MRKTIVNGLFVMGLFAGMSGISTVAFACDCKDHGTKKCDSSAMNCSDKACGEKNAKGEKCDCKGCSCEGHSCEDHDAKAKKHS